SDEQRAKAAGRLTGRPRAPNGQLLPIGSDKQSARSRRKTKAAQDTNIRQAVGLPLQPTNLPASQQGMIGNFAADGLRVRRALNLATMEGMLNAYRRGGQAAIDKVMKQSPAIFLKMLVLLVPRELEVSHSGTIKQMSDQQIEDAIAAIQAMMERRTIDVTP